MSAPSSNSIPFTFSEIPGNPSFRNSAVNAVALIPLLSSGNGSSSNNGEVAPTRSLSSFRDLLNALARHTTTATRTTHEDDLILVIPNSSLTRPGDWKYNESPLKSFHWQEGCQRLLLFDGLPQNSRAAHDRIMNQSMTRNWIDLCPYRRTAAVVGVLNMHDCKDLNDLHRAEEELHLWATQRYSTPSYEVTAHGRGSQRDIPVERLYVFDSFDEECQKIDLTKSNMGTSILAFPPSDQAHAQMLQLHLNVVVNDLAVAIFRTLENRIRESDEILKSKAEPQLWQQQQTSGTAAAAATSATSARRSLQRIISGSSSSDNIIMNKDNNASSGISSSEEPPTALSSGGGTTLSVDSIANLVSPDSMLAKDSSSASSSNNDNDNKTQAASKPTTLADSTSSSAKKGSLSSGAITTTSKAAAATSVVVNNKPSMAPQLLTPMDESWDLSQLSMKDVEAICKRDIGRREKLAADLSLLAGSPLDAYERYLKAASLCRTGTPDPLWYAMALEGCASAHIAMAEAGGYNVDNYLENNFQMPEEVMALARRSTTDDKRPASTGGNKQTLPEVVIALCEEALNITNRHKRLAAFQAELLLKMAWYTSESAEGHLRCRWGEGPGSFSGDPGSPPRWTQTSVSRLRFGDLKTKDDRDMTEINTLNRVKKVCELLQEAVSVGGLDAASRVDVAARSARLCLDGIQASQWKKVALDRVKLPRKAAFFMVTAAEAMSSMSKDSPSQTAEDLWLMACQLYSPKPNDLEKENSYGWATLRASTLHALSLQGNSSASQEAAELLLSLLVEISPRPPGKQEAVSKKNSSAPSGQKDATEIDVAEKPAVVARTESERKELPTSVDAEEPEGSFSATAIASKLRYNFTTMTAASTILAVESRWADEEVIRPVMVPMAGSDVSCLSLGAIWSSVDFQKCLAAQKLCIDRILALRKGLHTSSCLRDDTCAIYGTNPFETLPLHISSAMAIHAESFLELECVKKRSTPKADEGAMATFFNPYANKGKTAKARPTRVSEDEERVMLFQFRNSLALPLEISQCRLVFQGDVDERVKATKMSFIVPPLAKSFTVHFPFTVVAGPNPMDNMDTVEVKGISLACMGRSFFLPLRSQAVDQSAIRQLPDPSSVYPYKSTTKKKAEKEEEPNPQIETLPCQPRLQVYFPGSETPVDADTALQLGLTDAEVVETPSFRLGNYCGSSGRGKVERLQILVAGIPGVSEKLLYDSESPADAAVPEEEFINELLHKDNSPPLKVRLLDGKPLSLDSINTSDANEGTANAVTFQIATAHNVGEKIPEGTTISIRFRYCGQSTASIEVWRQRELSICISYFKGPYISSLSFRPDLSEESAYAGLCARLEKRNPLRTHGDEEVARETCMTSRVGLDAGIHVCGKRFVAILTVKNEIGESDIVLSRKDGAVGGFNGHPLKTVLVHKGVTARIPISIARFARVHEVGTASDLVEALTEKTSLRWESVASTVSSGTVGRKAHGLIRIPFGYLQELLSQSVPRICHPPCTVELTVGGKSVSSTPLTVAPGQPVDLAVKVDVASWVPKQVVDSCSLTLEFFSAREGRMTLATVDEKERDHIWCGKVRQSMKLAESTKAHTAKVVLIRGSHSISACARLSQGATDEVWWAPMVATIVVDPTKLPAQ